MHSFRKKLWTSTYLNLESYLPSMDLTLAEKGAEEDAVGFAKTFPGFPCVSQILGGPLLRLGLPRERLSIPSGSGWSGRSTGWLVTWDCPLRTDSASWKSLESFMQLISLCNSWILPVSSRIVSRSSINFLLEIHRLWTLEMASILPSHWDFSHELHEDPDFVPIIVHEEVVDLVDEVRLLDEHDKFHLVETR